ncbi:hypothetical protein TUM3794_20200 [Shewanella colwelliana]|uniref:Uncharacterized protein n=1 Tax=Shewanella colwelliana TaxID=23 RepID=A0ABQ4P0F5_SHECO|nr:recombinase RecT [Shewanella colwelliana]GIU40967.1 hypothetical protein TUM3794_20200 [Shewanella colwelliana]
MNMIQNILDQIADQLSLNQAQQDSLQALTTDLNITFEFGHDVYALKDVMPHSLTNAITPYLDAGLSLSPQYVALEARYHECNFNFEFEISHTYNGLVELLKQNAAVTNVIVNPVHENDELKIDHSQQVVYHTPVEDDSAIQGFYCIVELKNGESYLSQMSYDEAQQALYANTDRRLNGVNPYTTDNKRIECHKLSCLRRCLKVIAAHNNTESAEVINTLLNIHDRQFNAAKEQRKVLPLHNHKYRGCCKQPSQIDKLFKQVQGNTVVPFIAPTTKTVKGSDSDKNSLMLALDDSDLASWDNEELGVGF